MRKARTFRETSRLAMLFMSIGPPQRRSIGQKSAFGISAGLDTNSNHSMENLMHIVGLDHIQLAMPAAREDDARAFYDHLLGIPEVAKPPHLAARGGCWFESGSVKVHLGVEEPF